MLDGGLSRCMGSRRSIRPRPLHAVMSGQPGPLSKQEYSTADSRKCTQITASPNWIIRKATAELASIRVHLRASAVEYSCFRTPTLGATIHGAWDPTVAREAGISGPAALIEEIQIAWVGSNLKVLDILSQVLQRKRHRFSNSHFGLTVCQDVMAGLAPIGVRISDGTAKSSPSPCGRG